MEREILTYGPYFDDFMENLSLKVKEKIDYILMLLSIEDKVSSKFVKHIESVKGLYEIRVLVTTDIYRIFFCFDEGSIVLLFNGFKKKTQKTPRKEIEKARKIMKQYYESKK